MRTKILVVVGLILASACFATPPEGPAAGPAIDATNPTEIRFREAVRPFLDTYCLSCHGKEKPKGDFDLSAFTSARSAAEDLPRWELVLEQLEAKSMPPAKAPRHPSGEESRAIVEWVRAVRKQEADRNAGDPGRVAARRLSNAEYDNTIRDLTGVDMRPTREFPVDPANEAGFDNSAESLAMSPALVKKYLGAAREVADHVFLRPDGIAFAPYPMLADTDRDKYSVNRIIDFYRRHRTDFADYFLAAWQFRHREALGRPDASLDAIAAESRLSPGYLARIWDTLAGPPRQELGPIAAIRAMWQDLPPPQAGDREAARPGCEALRDFVVELRRQVTPVVENLPAPEINPGSQPLVLWKNRQMAANRMRYAGGAGSIKVDALGASEEAKRALAIPADPEAFGRFEASFAPFCSTFPDAFLVSERARVFLDPKQAKGNAGRLLSAGFHSMTGYFRDDGPLSELILDEAGRQELDRLWREFDFITGAPMRQYSSFLWYERAESRINMVSGPEFDFARAEDKAATSEAMIARLAEAYLAKARRLDVGEPALRAMADHFEIISGTIRRVERDRIAAEPRHVEALADLAGRAYRRPLSEAERLGIADFYRTLRESDGLNHEDAIRDSVVAILMSPHFCFRVGQPGGGPGVRPLSDHDLASRLSYFLWSSMPDEELLARAGRGDLHRPEVLVAQARRMLRDDRARGLATEFGGNWLDFRRFEEHNSVDRDRFKTFDDELRRSMFEEPVRFFLDVVRADRPVTDFLDAKHTFVNPALARHYGMPEPAAGPDGWARVDDASKYGRGGLLPMAVFLTRNSPGLRTSPVKRGYWVVRRLLGEAIPPPPADVPELPGDESKLGDLTLREALALHRADRSCAGCHERFDAIGLAFEGFGPVGEARDRDLGGRLVDLRATFPGGAEGVGVEGLRAYLGASRREEFVENLCRKLLAYALGRTLIPPDDAAVERMQARLAADGSRFGALIEAIVTSEQFLNRRVEGELAEARP